MSTRATYEFKDQYNSFTVYKHHDGYPNTRNGAYAHIMNAIEYAWEFPRFEADDFAAAFIAGNKTKGGGGVCLTGDKESHGDTAFHYVISVKDKSIFVERFEPIRDKDWNRTGWEKVEVGSLEEMVKIYCSE